MTARLSRAPVPNPHSVRLRVIPVDSESVWPAMALTRIVCV